MWSFGAGAAAIEPSPRNIVPSSVFVLEDVSGLRKEGRRLAVYSHLRRLPDGKGPHPHGDRDRARSGVGNHCASRLRRRRTLLMLF